MDAARRRHRDRAGHRAGSPPNRVRSSPPSPRKKWMGSESSNSRTPTRSRPPLWPVAPQIGLTLNGASIANVVHVAGTAAALQGLSFTSTASATEAASHTWQLNSGPNAQTAERQSVHDQHRTAGRHPVLGLHGLRTAHAPRADRRAGRRPTARGRRRRHPRRHRCASEPARRGGDLQPRQLPSRRHPERLHPPSHHVRST